MSKGPWKKGKKSDAVLTAGPLPAGEKIDGKAAEVPGSGHDLPPPLPPLAPSAAGPVPGEGAPLNPSPSAPGMNSAALKLGLAKTFCSTTQAIPYWLTLAAEKAGLSLRFESVAVAPEEGELWAEFAFPVLDKYMPRFRESPEYALLIVTAGIMAGKIRVKREVSLEKFGYPKPDPSGEPGRNGTDIDSRGVVPGLS